MKNFIVPILVLSAGAATAAPLPRAKIMANAESLTRVSWNMASNNMVCAGLASYESDFEPGPQIGVAYKWGGFDPPQTFLARLQEGKAAGSHSTHSPTALPCATGVDCSGFVSLIWELNQKESTASLHKVANTISFAELRPGDILNRAGSHVVLWVGRRDDGGPIFYEASGSAGKVQLNSTASWSYLNNYVPMRFKAVETTDSCAGTKAAPIVIPAFPFKDERTMYLSCSDEFDEYNCKAGTLETGREYIYSFELVRGGELDVKIDAPEGVDIDVHVLTALDENKCLARADRQLKQRFQAGKYFLVADSWTNHASIEQEGAFTLTADVKLDPAPVASGITLLDAGKVETTAPLTQPASADSKSESEKTCGCRSTAREESSTLIYLLGAALLLSRSRRR